MFFTKQRPISQEAKILQLLKKNRKWGVRNYELAKIALSYTKRVSELRRDGHNIQVIRVSQGIYKYYLNDPEDS